MSALDAEWVDIGIDADYLGMSWEPALPYAVLLEDANGYKESKSMFTNSSSFSSRIVLRGTLLLRLSHEEIRELKQQQTGSAPPFNFKVLGEPSVKIYCNARVVHLLNYKQKEVLLAINSVTDRHAAVDKVEWAEKLTEGSVVYVNIPDLFTVAKGIVRYTGKLPDEAGIKFGVQLLEHKYFGTSDGWFKDEQLFECEKDCAVFVGLDRLSESKESSVPAVTKPPSSSSSSGNKGQRNMQKQKSVEQQPKKAPFKIGDRVMAFDDDGGTVHGTVKWVGGSVGGNVGEIGKLIGIETDIPVNNKKFGGYITGMHHMFTPSGRRGKEYQLFLPFRAILSSKPEIPESPEVSINTQVAIKYAGNDRQVPDDIREQQAAALEKNKKEADKQKAKHVLKLDERDVDDTMNVETQQEILDKIKQKRESIPTQQGSGTHHSQGGKSDCNQGNGEINTQQNLQRNPIFSAGSEQFTYQSGSNQRINPQPNPQNQPTILRAGEMNPPRPQMDPHNQPPVLRAETDDRFHGNKGWPQQPNQYHAQPNDPHYAHMGSAYPHASGSAYHMQGSQHPHPPRSQQPYDYYGQQEMPPYQGGGGGGGGGGNAYMPTGGGGAVHPPYPAAPYQPPYDPNHDNYYIQQPNSQPINPYNLEVGSMVEYNGNHGVIKQIRGHMAGVEMDFAFNGGSDGTHNGVHIFDASPGKGLFVPLNHLRPIQQYMPQTTRKPNPFKLPHNLCEPSATTAHFVQAPEELNVGLHTGVKGIQGNQNSCYLDATLYGMFAFSNAFDALFLEKKCVDDFELRVKYTLEQKIVNPLRKVQAVVQDAIFGLREELSTLQKMKGLTSDEKDPEEFLNLLFKHVLHVDPFLYINRPSGTDKEFFIQLFVGPDENVPMPDTYWLLHKMFKDEKITFKEYPQKLLLQIPRHGKEFKAFERVKPTLKLDVSVLCEGYAGPCFVCDKPGEKLCNDCSQLEYLQDNLTLYFCEGCSLLWHSHPQRQSHKPVARKGTADTYPLELLSVLCIETSHYVCFTRITGSGKDQWVFFDSMATRTDDEYNLPRVTDCTDDINEWVYGDKDISKIPLKQLPELVRRYVGDPYLCIYTEFGGNLY